MKLNTSNLYFRSFVVLLVVVSAAFFWVLAPYYPSIFWGAILAIVFMPLYRRLLGKTKGRKNLSALITLLAIIVIVILPLALISASLIQEGATIYQRINNGEFSIGRYFEQIMNALPASVHDVLTRFGVGDMLSLREKLTEAAMQGSRFLASQAVNVGQNTFQFLVGLGIMLYVLFFLLRDGAHLAQRARDVIPLSDEHQQLLFKKFATVVRATVKGNIAVAATQGALGGADLLAAGYTRCSALGGSHGVFIAATSSGRRLDLVACCYLFPCQRLYGRGRGSYPVWRTGYRPG